MRETFVFSDVRNTTITNLLLEHNNDTTTRAKARLTHSMMEKRISRWLSKIIVIRSSGSSGSSRSSRDLDQDHRHRRTRKIRNGRATEGESGVDSSYKERETYLNNRKIGHKHDIWRERDGEHVLLLCCCCWCWFVFFTLRRHVSTLCGSPLFPTKTRQRRNVNKEATPRIMKDYTTDLTIFPCLKP